MPAALARGSQIVFHAPFDAVYAVLHLDAFVCLLERIDHSIDRILIDRDVSAVDPQALAATQVLETWVAGKKVWEKAPSAGSGERGR